MVRPHSEDLHPFLSGFIRTDILFQSWRCEGLNAKSNRQIKIHVYRKLQTSDSSWELLRIENKQIKTARNDSYG